MGKQKYPIGIQSFSEIRNNGYLYVDKTAYLHQLVDTGKYYFLSRPRRFGKSLMISTLEALFKGERELFKGLAIDSLEWDWQPHEVLHLDLNARNYKSEDSLDTILNRHLEDWESKYKITPKNSIPEDRFINVIKKAYEISGRGVAILIDEYDKPLLATIGDAYLQNIYRKQLQAFYGVMKSLDEYIKFGILTGVTRFSKVSIFSSLNNLRDISLIQKFNSICGITESELSNNFDEGIKEMSVAQDISIDRIHAELKSYYDGYHFAPRGEDIYNPFSLLNTFSNQEFGFYWLATGTTSSLFDVLNISTFPICDLEGYRCSEHLLTGSDIFLSDPIPFLFQSGYLTIKGYDPEFNEYKLGFPNKEVAQGFNDLVMKTYMRVSEPSSLINELIRDVRKGRVDNFMNKLQSFIAGIPYDHFKSENNKEQYDGIIGNKEIHFQNVMYVIMKLMGFLTHTEFKTSNGRIDMVVETKDYIYVMEFKINSSPKKALKQINEKGYTLPFRTSGKKIYKIGTNFNTKTRRLSDWITEEE